MPRYPNVSDTPDRFDAEGNKLCRNCSNLVARTRKHYCSKQCLDEFNRNNTWFLVRKDVLKRDKYKCSICNKRYRKVELDVDHIIPIHQGGKPFEKANLRTLCKDCHKRKTKLDREVFSE